MKIKKIKGSNYRPLLYFSDTVIRSVLIHLEDEPYLEMGKQYKNILFGIYFYSDLDITKEFFTGRKFDILEGSTFIGSGEITALIGLS